MDVFYPDTSFCEGVRLIESLSGESKSTMALEEEELLQENSQELLSLLACVKNNSNEVEVENCMHLLADSLDDEVDVDTELLERKQAHLTVLDVMRSHETSHKIQLHSCFVLHRFVELNPRIQSELQERKAHRDILKMMKLHSNRMNQVIGCKMLSALCTSTRMRSHALDSRAVDFVLSAMSYFGEDEEFYIPAFEALTQLLRDDPSAQEDLINMEEKKPPRKKYRIVVETMEKFTKSGDIQEQGIRLMCVLASSNKNCQALVHGRTFMVALEAMKKHCDRGGVQAVGCRLLVLLAALEPHRAILVQQNVVLNVILRALRQFKGCMEVQKNGLTALALLTEELDDKLQGSLQNYSWTHQVFTAMTSHYDKPEVLIAACRALQELIDFCPDVLTEIGEDGNALPIHNCCMAALMLHADDLELCVSACRVLASMVNMSNPLRESLMSKGLYVHIVEAMKQHKKEPQAQQWGCRGLRGLSLSGFHHKELLINCGVLELVFDCNWRFRDNIFVQQEAIALIACLATDVELVLHQSAIEGIHGTILNAMNSFPDQVSLCEISLEALGVLSAAEEVPHLLASAEYGGLNTIFDAMIKHLNEPAIQQKGCILIQVLAPFLSDEHCQKAVSSVLEAMCKYREDRDVQAEGCVAMLIIAQIDETKSSILVNNCAHERLFFILENFVEEPDLVFLASECIRYLGLERNLKTQMLLSACAGGLLKGADCLIKKGADVNAGQGENTPLCHACKNGKEEIVQLLLTQGITDIQSALRLSLEMGHDNIVGLLLQHLGHDKEAGIIAFSKLNLGDLRPEWLSPSLSGFKYSPPDLSAGWSEFIDDAKRTMERRASLNSRLRRKGSESMLNKSLGASFTNSKADSFSLDRETSFTFESIDYSDSDSDLDFDLPELSEDSPLRARSVSGASLPYSSHDPRIVSPFSYDNCVILPRSPRKVSVEEPMPSRQRPVLTRRSASDVNSPVRSFKDYFSRIVSDSEEADAILESGDDVQQPGMFKMPNGSYVYSWDTQESYRERTLSAPCQIESGKLLHFAARKERRTARTFEERRKRRESIRVLSASATVLSIDASSNNIVSIDPLADASSLLLAHLAKVERLDLSHNHLERFPPKLCDAMPVLRYVNLSHNEFKDFPFCFVNESSMVKLLNLSHNKIEMKSYPSFRGTNSMMLENLNLSHNGETCFPERLGELFPGLTSLYVSGNSIKKLPDCSLNLPQLKTLDLSNNQLSEIPPEFFADSSALETLLASSNLLSALPEAAAPSLKNLKTVRLNKNKLGETSTKKQFSISRFFLKLPNLKILDLSSNNLEDIPPPIAWSSRQLKELVLAENKIRKLSLEGVKNWSFLERLILSGNCLKQVPDGIGELTSLTSLDLSRNTGITHLPDEMGRLSNLWDLQLADLKLDLNSGILESRAQELIGFLHSKLKNSVPYYRMKLVVVGQAGRGKTALLSWLREHNATGPHPDVTMREWCVKDPKAECKECHRKSVDYVFSTWDLKGRDDLYSAYQCLLSSRTLFLVVFDVSKGVSEIDALKPWLLNIHACASEASVMLVGTHKDKVPKDQESEVFKAVTDRALSMCAGAGFPQITSIVALDCTKDTPGMKGFRSNIVQLITKCKCKGSSLIGPTVPQNFVKLQDLIQRYIRTEDSRRILTMAKIRKLIQDKKIFMDDTEIEQAIKFLSEAGVLIHIDDPACRLNDLLFVVPIWVYKLLAHVVTRRDVKNVDGIIGVAELENLVREGSGVVNVNSDLMPQILKLLEHYCIALPLRDDKYILPSLLSKKQPSLKIPNSEGNVSRMYKLAYVPPSFWPRLLTRVQTFVVNLYMDHRVRMESPREPQVTQWNSGVYLYWADQAFCLISQGLTNSHSDTVVISPHSDTVVITTPSTVHGARILAHVVDHLDTLLEEWFPDLCKLDPEGSPLVKKQAECLVCKGEKAHTFSLNALAQASENEFVMCPNTKLLVALRQIAPDVVMEDVGDQYRIDGSKLELDIKRARLLGDGAFGHVYRARYNGKPVAAKVFHVRNEDNPHTLLRQELIFLRKLRHLSIITMVGICMRPWSLILEIAPMGCLGSLLSNGQALSRGIQHRIALQVAEGLVFLHHHMIVYRDLKPNNVLIFSLSVANLINAKICDYGVARYATRCGLTASEGTPGYRAPEIARGDVTYNLEADLYSFGMFLYELVTGGTKPFEDLRFQHELDAAVLKGRALDPITASQCPPWPDFADLIAHALEPLPSRRISAVQAYSRLCDPELICLKREIAVCKGQTVECMTIRHFTENNTPKLEVWVGSGQSDNQSGQVTIIDLSEMGVEGCTGTFIRDKRVKSILAVESDTVLAGTQSGKIWVFDAWDHKCLFDLPELRHAILCLKQYKDDEVNVVLAGLANGQLAVYNSCSLRVEDTSPTYFDLCDSKILKGTSCADCDIHPVACMAIGKRRLFCGCGSEIVVLRVKKSKETKVDKGDSSGVVIEIERRWAVNDRAKGLVLNIAVGSSFIWISTRESPVVECWNFFKAKFVGSVDCLTILRDAGYTGNLRETRVLSVLLSHKTLWVGLGTGHVVLVDPSTQKPLKLIHRHVSAVRCLADTHSSSSPKSTSLVLTGGMGFIERHGCEWKKAISECGYTLVWEADFMEQAKHLEDHIRRRRELSNTLVE